MIGKNSLEQKICIIMGTRPEIIKFAPLIREFECEGFDFDVIFTGQHYDYRLSKVFFKDLNLENPNYHLKIGKGSQGMQTGKILIKLEKILNNIKPNIVLVQGDTNSALAGALNAVKLQIKLGHIEAGLRSYDYRMPEEHNRRIIDHISDLLFAPTDNSVEILKSENVRGKIYNTGNTVIDACIQHLKLVEEKSNIMSNIPFNNFILVTSHRAENVDNPNILKNLTDLFLDIPKKIVFPLHPRTRKRLKQYGLYEKLINAKHILILPPLGYFDLLKLMQKCDFIITDSGGIQEEATAPGINKFTFVIRKTTDRPESCEVGFSKLVGTTKNDILNSIKVFLKNRTDVPNKSPYGDGHTSKKISSIILKELKN